MTGCGSWGAEVKRATVNMLHLICNALIFVLGIMFVIHLLTHAFFSRLLPSGDSSCTYVPVKYRWTKADFPLDRFPTIPCKSKSKKLWDDVQVQVTWQRKRKKNPTTKALKLHKSCCFEFYFFIFSFQKTEASTSIIKALQVFSPVCANCVWQKGKHCIKVNNIRNKTISTSYLIPNL